MGIACLLSGFAVGFLSDHPCRDKPSVTHVRTQKPSPDKDTIKVDTVRELKLDDNTLMAELRRIGISHPEIVLAQAKLETGNYKSRLCVENNNLFGLRHGKGYYCFTTWQESVQAYKDYVQYRYKGGDYFEFLECIGYAESPEYTTRLRKMLP